MQTARRGLCFCLALAFSFISSVLAVDFTQCLADIRNLPNGTEGLVDNHGNPVNISFNATAISYGLCKSQCGTDSAAFEWSVFSQQFSSWLLPWLALISQLPFGAKLRTDNVMSMVLNVGSPVLGAYSLALTVLNSQWLARRFSGYKYPNLRNVVKVLSSLQQVPLTIRSEHGLLASIVVLPENDEWWAELADGLDYIHTWSISAVSSIAWVVIAYLFTVIDSFAQVSENINSNGQGVGSVWLWLLPIVIGWLQVSPKCDFDRVSSALDKANKIAYIATSDPDTPLLVLNQTEERAFMLESYRPGSVHRDEESSAPVFNYARFFPWVHAVEQVAEAYHMASENALVHRPVNGSREWVVGAPAEVKKANRRGILEDVERYCRVGPDGRSPHQYDAEDGMIECYTPPGTPQFPVPMIEILPVSMESIRSNSSIQPGHKRVAPAAKTSPWGREVWTRVIMASLLALFLQWGTAGASIMVVWFTPTIGLGCRSGAYILYALASTVIWAIMLLSSILAHYAHLPRPHSHHLQLRYVVNTAAARLSVALRRLGKLLAILNALWIVVTCLFQFSSFFDRCWCDSSVLGLGPRKAYDVLVLTDADIKPMTAAWIGAIVLALGSAFIYVGALNLIINPPLPDS